LHTEPYHILGDNALARELLGWEPKIPLKQVITALIGWYKKNRGPIGQIGPVVIHYKLTKKENGYRAT
jgi:dTDP-D-glucose 4,6-dehydratase